jgi:quinoprotein glucose dehydrogenase
MLIWSRVHGLTAGVRRARLITRHLGARLWVALWAIGVFGIGPRAARAQRAPAGADAGEWHAYARDRGGSRYAPLAEVTPANVGRLRVAWRFSTGEAGPAYATRRRTSFEATPLVVGGTMYLSTPLGRVFALDAATGRERWRFNPGVPRGAAFGDFTSRGVSYWADPRARRGIRCAHRVFVATIDARLIALDAGDGATCPGFGDGGAVDLRVGLRNAPTEFSEYAVTSPPAVVNGVLVVGSAVADNQQTRAASGEVRGFDARTGRQLWRFDPVPQSPADPAYATWHGPAGSSPAEAHRTGGANAWSVFAADTARDLVFVPTSSPSVDYWGGARLGDNRYANSVVALRASTGRLVWHFQTVHHDLWDYDNASPPVLTTVTRAGRRVDVVLQATKTGMLFVLDRETGSPVLPVEERAVPPSAAAGEEAAPTQPFSSVVLSPLTMRPDEAFGADSADRVACRAILAALRHDGPFTPPSVEGTLVMPSNIGGAHWGGVAVDPVRQLAVVPVNHVAAVVQLIPRAEYDHAREEPGWEYAEMRGTPYWMRRRILLSPKRVPCSPPPFGALVAVDLQRGAIAWRVPLGTPGPLAPLRGGDTAAAPGVGATTGSARPSIYRQALAVRGTPDGAAGASDSAAFRALGSPNLGGAIVTASGLAFIGATLDRQLRAFDVATGRELWRGALPAGAKATPMTYRAGGRQFVAIAAGGDGDAFGRGDEVVAFALPDRPRR